MIDLDEFNNVWRGVVRKTLWFSFQDLRSIIDRSRLFPAIHTFLSRFPFEKEIVTIKKWTNKDQWEETHGNLGEMGKIRWSLILFNKRLVKFFSDIHWKVIKLNSCNFKSNYFRLSITLGNYSEWARNIWRPALCIFIGREHKLYGHSLYGKV